MFSAFRGGQASKRELSLARVEMDKAELHAFTLESRLARAEANIRDATEQEKVGVIDKEGGFD